MIFHQVEQNTPEWLMLRLGIPTASEFDKIVTPKKGDLSAQSDGYMNRLLAEWATGAPLENETTVWMDRGQELEDSAVEAAEMILGCETERIGFITNNVGTIGCSPDRLRSNGKRGVECKCPSAPVHVAYMRGDRNALDDRYRCQLAGQIWIAEFDGVDVVSFHPQLPTVLIPVERDDRMQEFIGNMSVAVEGFAARLAAIKIELDEKYGILDRIAEMRKRRAEGQQTDGLGVSEEDTQIIWDYTERARHK